MNYTYTNKRNEENDRRKSAIITFIVALFVLLALYLYKFYRIIPLEEEVTTMLINFGDNQNGNGPEEPTNQEGSLASTADIAVTEPKPQPTPAIKEKIITGKNVKISAPKSEKTEKSQNVTTKTKFPNKTAVSTSKTKNANTKSQGDGKGTAAIGNLIKGRGTNTGSQGTNGTTGNAGDPLGGNGNGDSKIGVDRNLIAFIPGTEGKSGSKPTHNCAASGKISIAYVVDKAGNVTSAKRSSGISDPCVVSTSVSWVKKYVKAEKANTSSTGTYRITF